MTEIGSWLAWEGRQDILIVWSWKGEIEQKPGKLLLPKKILSASIRELKEKKLCLEIGTLYISFLLRFSSRSPNTGKRLKGSANNILCEQ